MRKGIRAFLLVTLALFLFHALFHLFDWMVWGLQLGGFDHLRRPLATFFGHHWFGWAFHSLVNLMALGALLYATLRWPGSDRGTGG